MINLFILIGLPEFDFPSLDPLVYEDGRVVFNSGEIRGEVIFSNVTAIGLSKARFSDVRTHFLNDVFRLEIDVQMPKLYGEGYVELDGTINLFRVTGKGTILNCNKKIYRETSFTFRGVFSFMKVKN